MRSAKLVRSGVAIGALCVGLLAGLGAARAEGGTWPANAQVYLLAPADGAIVKGPVRVVFGLKGLGVAPAGVDKANTGHHHLLIDTDIPSGAALEESLPADDQHKHFGGGQTETTITLPPGRHTLQLIMGDANHIPHNPPLTSAKITITVQ